MTPLTPVASLVRVSTAGQAGDDLAVLVDLDAEKMLRSGPVAPQTAVSSSLTADLGCIPLPLGGET